MVYLLRRQNETAIVDEVDATVTIQQEDWPNIRTRGQYAPDWAEVCRKLTDQLSKLYRDLVWENGLLLINCGILYLNFINACQNGYGGYMEKCIQLFAIMLQGIKFRNYASKILHMIACF